VPELPDIEAYRVALESRIVGRRLERVRLKSPFFLRTTEPRISEAQGRFVEELRRMGKRLVLGLDEERFLVLHLMVAGRLAWRARGAASSGRAGLAAFEFDAGTLLVTEAGSKRRASLHFVAGKTALAQFTRGGIEPLEAAYDVFCGALSAESHTLKRALTDPRLFSGIGNAYSDEILHRARLSPFRRTTSLGASESRRLYQAMRETLREWTYRAVAQARRAFPEKVTAFREGMAVHGRFGKPCPVCGSPVQRVVFAENEANYCPACQTGGRLLADRALSKLLKEDWPRTLAELEERSDRLRI
jgi:formamidopyrimidine-DNA glycosylase